MTQLLHSGQIVHFSDRRKLHGIRCNHSFKRRSHIGVTNRWNWVTCKMCLGHRP